MSNSAVLLSTHQLTREELFEVMEGMRQPGTDIDPEDVLDARISRDEKYIWVFLYDAGVEELPEEDRSHIDEVLGGIPQSCVVIEISRQSGSQELAVERVQQQWNHYVAPVVNHFVAPAEHFAQQMEEQVLQKVQRGLTLWHVVGVIVFGVVIYGLWRFTASSPPAGWTRPEWGELIHNEGVTHQWYTRNGNGPRSVTTHVMSKHVGMDPLSLLKRTME
ncbi:MAG TPA: hypothetical protein VNG51_11605 [Ktedonobacteraceae bacterium]|nr:hypothetical protein [Ktedonobacteraceae bacterium]